MAVYFLLACYIHCWLRPEVHKTTQTTHTYLSIGSKRLNHAHCQSVGQFLPGQLPTHPAEPAGAVLVHGGHKTSPRVASTRHVVVRVDAHDHHPVLWEVKGGNSEWGMVAGVGSDISYHMFTNPGHP